MPRAVVLCPLEIERRAIARALSAAYRRMPPAARSLAPDIIRTGPGPVAVSTVVFSLAEREERPTLVVLAGLAGGLAPTSLTPRIGGVVDLERHRWIPTVRPDLPGEEVTVVGVDDPVTTRAEKMALRARTKAQLVDCESHAFARACHRVGLAWSVVRAVSDGPDDALPPKAGAWVDAGGQTRPLRVAADLAMDPRLIPVVRRLGKRASAALAALAPSVARVVQAHATTMATP